MGTFLFRDSGGLPVPHLGSSQPGLEISVFRNRKHFDFPSGTIYFFTSCIKSTCCCDCTTLRKKVEHLEAKIVERPVLGERRRDVEGWLGLR